MKGNIARPRCRWVDNIKMNLIELGWGSMEWIVLAQDRDQWRAHEQGKECSNSIKCWEILG
jgi:hypothetical protein